MTRAELVLLLASLTKRGVISETDAARLVQLFDAGELVPADLPQEDSGNEWLLGLAIVLLLTRGNTTTKLSAAKRRFARNTLRRGFEADVQRLAERVTSGKLPIQAWQKEMQVTVAQYTRQMATAGAGTLPSKAVRDLVEAQLAGQAPFLSRFTVEMVARSEAGKPMSMAAVASRSKLYGAVAWGAFFQGQGDNAQRGVVEQWLSRDDGRVCPRCAPRHGQYFLPGQPPFPGPDCYGSCRCVRVPVFAPEIYEQLSGQRAA